MTGYSKVEILAEKNMLHNQAGVKDNDFELYTPEDDK